MASAIDMRVRPMDMRTNMATRKIKLRGKEMIEQWTTESAKTRTASTEMFVNIALLGPIDGIV